MHMIDAYVSWWCDLYFFGGTINYLLFFLVCLKDTPLHGGSFWSEIFLQEV